MTSPVAEIEDTPLAIERLADLIEDALVGISNGEVFPTDRLTDILLDMRAAVIEADQTIHQLSMVLTYALRNVPHGEPFEPVSTFGAEHTLLVQTSSHDLILRCVGRDEWLIVRFEAGADEPTVEPVMFTREWVRRYVERLNADGE